MSQYETFMGLLVGSVFVSVAISTFADGSVMATTHPHTGFRGGQAQRNALCRVMGLSLPHPYNPAYAAHTIPCDGEGTCSPVFSPSPPGWAGRGTVFDPKVCLRGNVGQPKGCPLWAGLALPLRKRPFKPAPKVSPRQPGWGREPGGEVNQTIG